MKQSMRAKRMARNHKRMKSGSLNLTALMDIFTILVFFLMVNSSSDVQLLQDSDKITMPVSVAEQEPRDTLVIQVNNEEILVSGQKIVDIDIAALRESGVDTIAELAEELQYHASRRPRLTDEERLKGRAITIQGHHEIPYILLRKIMATCAETEFRDISLAVTRLEQSSPVEEGANEGT